MADEPIQLSGVSQAPFTPASYKAGMAIPALSAFSSGLQPNPTQSTIAAGAILTGAAGVLSIQRYIDTGGLIPQGAATTLALSDGIAASTTIGDGNPWLSYTVTVTPNGGAAATLTNLSITLRAVEVAGGTAGSPFAVSGAVSLSGGTVVGIVGTVPVSGTVAISGGTVAVTGTVALSDSSQVSLVDTNATAFGTSSNPISVADSSVATVLTALDNADATLYRQMVEHLVLVIGELRKSNMILQEAFGMSFDLDQPASELLPPL